MYTTIRHCYYGSDCPQFSQPRWVSDSKALHRVQLQLPFFWKFKHQVVLQILYHHTVKAVPLSHCTLHRIITYDVVLRNVLHATASLVQLCFLHRHEDMRKAKLNLHFAFSHVFIPSLFMPDSISIAMKPKIHNTFLRNVTSLSFKRSYAALPLWSSFPKRMATLLYIYQIFRHDKHKQLFALPPTLPCQSCWQTQAQLHTLLIARSRGCHWSSDQLAHFTARNGR